MGKVHGVQTGLLRLRGRFRNARPVQVDLASQVRNKCSSGTLIVSVTKSQVEAEQRNAYKVLLMVEDVHSVYERPTVTLNR